MDEEPAAPPAPPEPAAPPEPPERTASQAARASLATAGTGIVRALALWPGLFVIPAVYAVVVASTSSLTYAYLIAALAAGAAGTLWYASPLGRAEARRRASRAELS